MLNKEATGEPGAELSADAIREQLDLLVQDPSFRSSKRSVQFLTYVVEQTLHGQADHIKERTIGVEVFGREPSYDTNVDHVVRTAAIELRKRLATYYDEERHRSELRLSLLPGSYIPRFSHPSQLPPGADEASHSAHFSFQISPGTADSHKPELPELPLAPKRRTHLGVIAATTLLLLLIVFAYRWTQQSTAQDLFWKPVLDTPGSVLLAVGDVPNGPPTATVPDGDQGTPVPIVHKTSAPVVPFADAVTIARVLGVLESHGKKVIIRREGASSFSDLREGPVVLVGAFNNEWSLRLTRKLRYTLALDADKHLIYIKDAKSPNSRSWSWATDSPTNLQPGAGGPALQDYALISRIWNSETGHVVIVIGGLYTYGTEAAGEFLNDPQMMEAVARVTPLDNPRVNLQIILGTTVTDKTPGPPRVLAVSTE